MAVHKFQTEVNELLKLIIHSLYSHREVFLRELVSNASDALHKLKFLTLTDDAFKNLAWSPRIDISIDPKAATLTVSDNGIGMDDKDLVEQLGTIARSGTREFLERFRSPGGGLTVSADDLIGQFGVGFYSAFMVADRVEVLTRKAGDERAWLWRSDGLGEFTVEPAERETHGTSVKLFLHDEAKEFLDRGRLEGLLRRYSDHIAFPIVLAEETPKGLRSEQVNIGSALWKRPKSEISDEDYDNFYKTVFHDTEPPLLKLHIAAEGTVEYTALFFVPRRPPADLYMADYEPGVRLYVRRVFIMDDAKELLPAYLRFVRGVIDSEDLPLNVSREMLQHNRIYAKIRAAAVKRLLAEFLRLAKDDPATYREFWRLYGRPLKEGLVQDPENRQELLDLLRFRSLRTGDLLSLAEYVQAAPPDRKVIYYLAGRRDADPASSPLLEGYKARGYDVLLMEDDLDEPLIHAVRRYGDHEFRSVHHDDSLFEPVPQETRERLKPFLEKAKAWLADDIKDVVLTSRLKDSPCCLTAAKGDPSLHMQSVMRHLGLGHLATEAKPVLELNPDHPVVRRAAESQDETRQQEVLRILLDEALLLEGFRPKDPAAFARRLNDLVARLLDA